MRARTSFHIGAMIMLMLGLNGCDGSWCIGDDCSCGYDTENSDCPDEWGCSDYDDWDDYPDSHSTYCDMQTPCEDGMVCSTDSHCEEIVDNCPLTDECLGDPEGYNPEWQGVDPVFIGEFNGDELTGQVDVLLDFYDDHIYGQINVAVVTVTDGEYFYYDYMQGVITGSRDGAMLRGQIVPPWMDRAYDATFDAQLTSASEIQGVVTVSSDHGTQTADFILFRTTPCGCDTSIPCRSDAQCPEGQSCTQGQCKPQLPCETNSDCEQSSVCLDGLCVSVCMQDSDCPDGQVCQNHECTQGCPSECCQDEDCSEANVCVEGTCLPACQRDECCRDNDCVPGYECVEGQCLNPCVTSCDCEQCEDCIDGYCRPA